MLSKFEAWERNRAKKYVEIEKLINNIKTISCNTCRKIKKIIDEV